MGEWEWKRENLSKILEVQMKVDLRIIPTDDQMKILDQHRLLARSAYNGMLMVSNAMRNATTKEKKKAFQDRKSGSGFENCSSYVARWAADEAIRDWHEFTQGRVNEMPGLREMTWPFIRFGRPDLKVKIRYGELQLPRAFGRARYELEGVDQDFDFSAKWVEILKAGPGNWWFVGCTTKKELGR